MKKQAKIFVAGASGMLGKSLMRFLCTEGYANILAPSHAQLDLMVQADVDAYFRREKPDYVFLLAGRVGGIADNRDHQADALMINSQIELNVITAAWKNQVKKLVFAASLTVYPEQAPQPMEENLLLTGPFESFWGGYALAKALGVKLCEYLNAQYGTEYSAAVLPNLYGNIIRDGGGTVLPTLIAKFHSAVIKGEDYVEVWGTGNARREFLNADDLADALVFLVDHHTGGHINVGTGSDISIGELAEMIQRVSGFRGAIRYDTGKPEGMARKLLDSTKIRALGWMPKVTLEQGVAEMYRDYALRH